MRTYTLSITRKLEDVDQAVDQYHAKGYDWDGTMYPVKNTSLWRIVLVKMIPLFLILLTFVACDTPLADDPVDYETERLIQIHKNYVEQFLGEEVIHDDWSLVRYCEDIELNEVWEIWRPCGNVCRSSGEVCTLEFDNGIIEYEGKLYRWTEYVPPTSAQ